MSLMSKKWIYWSMAHCMCWMHCETDGYLIACNLLSSARLVKLPDHVISLKPEQCGFWLIAACFREDARQTKRITPLSDSIPKRSILYYWLMRISITPDYCHGWAHGASEVRFIEQRQPQIYFSSCSKTVPIFNKKELNIAISRTIKTDHHRNTTR